MLDFEEMFKLVENKLSAKRFYHTQNVANLGAELALLYDVDVRKTALACLLHDITKEESLKLQLQNLQNSDIIVKNEIKISPALYHSKTGMLFVRDKLKITDEEILNAISYHTTGAKNMTMLQKIVYVADAISLDRKYKGVEQYRKLAKQDLEKCMLELITYSMKDLLAKHFTIPIDTIECYNELCVGMIDKKEEA